MTPVLTIEGLVAGYGEARVLTGVSLVLAEASAMALLGRNGMGKTTLVASILGLTDRVAGTITLAGRELTALRPDLRVAAGIGWVPQQRNIFASLTVEENLLAVARPGQWTPSRIFTLFPRLEARRRHLGWQLSGGEQQMLALARALVLNPRLLLLDEPLEGLAPLVVAELMDTLRQVIRAEGVAAILVEQNVHQALSVTEQATILERGRVVYEGASRALQNDPERLTAYLGVSPRSGLPGGVPAPRLGQHD